MSIVTIVDSEGVKVDSHGDGWAYAINLGTAPGPFRTLWFQDEEATRIRQQIEELEKQSPETLTSQIWLSAIEDHL